MPWTLKDGSVVSDEEFQSWSKNKQFGQLVGNTEAVRANMKGKNGAKPGTVVPRCVVEKISATNKAVWSDPALRLAHSKTMKAKRAAETPEQKALRIAAIKAGMAKSERPPETPEQKVLRGAAIKANWAKRRNDKLAQAKTED